MAIIIAGHGRIGSALFSQLGKQHEVYALRRSFSAEHNVICYPLLESVDKSERAKLIRLLPESIDYAFFVLSPIERTENAYYDAYINAQQAFLKLIKSYDINHYFFISSTAVFSQNNCQWVDESSEVNPVNFNGRIMLEAEQLAHGYQLPCTSIRFSGIYGPKPSLLVERVRQWAAGDGSKAPSAQWSNRIYYQDAVNTLTHLLNYHSQGNDLAQCYIGTDDEPTLNIALYQQLAELLELQAPLPDAPLTNTIQTGKRLSNTLLKKTGYQFGAPSFREGYALMSQHRI